MAVERAGFAECAEYLPQLKAKCNVQYSMNKSKESQLKLNSQCSPYIPLKTSNHCKNSTWNCHVHIIVCMHQQERNWFSKAMQWDLAVECVPRLDIDGISSACAEELEFLRAFFRSHSPHISSSAPLPPSAAI